MSFFSKEDTEMFFPETTSYKEDEAKTFHTGLFHYPLHMLFFIINVSFL